MFHKKLITLRSQSSMETLKEKTTRGLFWGGMNNVVQQGLGLLFGIILGRLLNPEDYGMIAMILVFQLIANALQESGFKSAIGNLKEPQHNDYNSVFWFNIIVGVTCYVILFFVAPLIADYYHTPELVLLCRVAFLTIIFAALGTAQSAYLFRNMMVKEQAKCNMTATLLSSIIGVTLAFLKCGYWALAIQSMAYIGLNSMLLWYFSPWRPTLHLDFGPVKHMFRFSSKLLATTILERINTNVMNILLGRHFTKHEVGNYNQAYQWNSKVFYLLQGTLAQVAQPVFTNVADEQERQLRILRKLMRFTAFLAFPMLFGFGLVAQEFIVLTIGEKWLSSLHHTHRHHADALSLWHPLNGHRLRYNICAMDAGVAFLRQPTDGLYPLGTPTRHRTLRHDCLWRDGSNVVGYTEHQSAGSALTSTYLDGCSSLLYCHEIASSENTRRVHGLY